MRLYVVGIENFPKLCDALRKRDLSVQVITDAHQVDCDCLLRIWTKENRFSLVQISGILNFDGVYALLAVPNTLLWRLRGWILSWKFKGQCV